MPTIPSFQLTHLFTKDSKTFTSKISFEDSIKLKFEKYSENSCKFKFIFENKSSEKNLIFQNGNRILKNSEGKISLAEGSSLCFCLSVESCSNVFRLGDAYLLKFVEYLDVPMVDRPKKRKLHVENEPIESFELLENEQVLCYKIGTPHNTSPSKKVKLAMFDMDGTIIHPKSGKKFPVDENDWQFLYSKNQIFKKIKKIYEDDDARNLTKIIIISNQNGYSKEKLREDNTRTEKREKLKEKISNIFFKEFYQSTKIPIIAYFTFEKGLYRKPCNGILNLILKELNLSSENDINKEESFYCGDAAGRPEVKQLKIKKDFSASDYKFALNCGIKFITPEIFFLNDFTRKVPKIRDISSFDPRSFRENKYNLTNFEPVSRILVITGLPGSGKSTLARIIAENDNSYHIVNQDILKTKEKFMKNFKELLNQPAHKTKIILDRTNGTLKDRLEFIELAKKYKSTIEVVYLKFDEVDRVKHNATFRSISRNLPDMPAVVFATVKKNFVIPEEGEGFDKVTVLEDPLFELPGEDLFYKFLV